MFIITKRLTRARAVVCVLLLGLFLAGIVLLTGACQHSKQEEPPLIQSNADRIAYLAALGWQVKEEPVETLRLQLPKEFSKTDYSAYQELQLSQGFDLTPFSGKQVVRYTYTVENYPGRSDAVQLNLYCCDDSIIAGDVMALGENGFQGPLTFPSAE